MPRDQILALAFKLRRAFVRFVLSRLWADLLTNLRDLHTRSVLSVSAIGLAITQRDFDLFHF